MFGECSLLQLLEELLVPLKVCRTAGSICADTGLFNSFALPLLRLHLLGKAGLGADGAGTMCRLERRFTVIQRVCVRWSLFSSLASSSYNMEAYCLEK